MPTQIEPAGGASAGSAAPTATCCRRAGQCPVPLAAAGQNTKPAAIDQSGWFLRICGFPRRLRVGVADTGSACRPPIRGETCGFADPEGFNLWPSGASPEPAAASACRLSLPPPASSSRQCRLPIRRETCGFEDPEGFNLWPSGASPEPAAASACRLSLPAASACRLSLQKPTPAV